MTLKTSAKYKSFLQCSTLEMPNERRTSTQAPNIRGLLQCSTPALTIEDVVQQKRQI